MDTMGEKDKFVARFDQAFKNEGLTDVKFCVKDGHAMTIEEFYAEANRFDAAAADSKPVDLATLDAQFRAK